MLKEKLQELNNIMMRLRNYDLPPTIADIDASTTLLEEIAVEVMVMKPGETVGANIALVDFFTSLPPEDQFELVKKMLLSYNSIIQSARVVIDNTVDGNLNQESISKALMQLLKQFLPPTPPTENDPPKAP